MKFAKYSLTFLAVLAFVSCKNDNIEQKIEIGDRVSVNFLAGSVSSRTTFTEKTALGYYPVRWTDSDNVAVSLNASSWQTLAAVPSESKATASFSGEFTASESYRFYAVSPAAAVKDLNTTKGAWLLNIPWQQTPGEASADPDAIILGASTDETAALPNPVSFMFGHLTAYLRLTLTNLTDSYGAVQSIDLACTQAFAGDWYYNLADGTFEAREASRSLRLTTTSVEDQWIACAPVDMSGQTLTITVNFADGSVRRSVEFPSGRQYARGMVSTLSVNMNTAEAVSASEADASFLANEVPGFYPAGGTAVTYQAGTNQLSRTYSGSSVTFSIITPSDNSIVRAEGIPADAAVGDSFTLSYSTLSELGGSSANYSVSVVKEDGALLWLLSSAGDKFIVKK